MGGRSHTPGEDSARRRGGPDVEVTRVEREAALRDALDAALAGAADRPAPSDSDQGKSEAEYLADVPPHHGA